MKIDEGGLQRNINRQKFAKNKGITLKTTKRFLQFNAFANANVIFIYKKRRRLNSTTGG